MNDADEQSLDEIFAERWPKPCSCGLEFSEDEWESLEYVGVQRSGMDDVPDLELRNCGRCHSTVAIAVTRDFIKTV